MNIVVVSLQRINADRESTSTCLAMELSKYHQVLYINPPIDRKSLYLGDHDVYTANHINLIKRKEKGLYQLAPNLHVLDPGNIIESINWITNDQLYAFFNKRNNKKFAKDIQEAIDHLGFNSFILINDKDILRSFYLKDLLKPKLNIYLDRDYMFDNPYWQKHGTGMEPKLMEKSDIILCNSPSFTKNALKYNKNSFYIGNGCGLNMHSDQHIMNIPEQLKHIGKPIIGYVGAITSLRLDLNLLIRIAQQKTEWNFVFLGPDDEDFRNSDLYKLENVHYLGKTNKKEVPAFICHFDVCMNPQLINRTTIGNFPLKIIEYLLCGKPVVATSTDLMIEEFSTTTYLALGEADFIDKIQLALSEDSVLLAEKRRSYVEKFSWNKITAQVLSIIESHEQKNANALAS